MLPFETGFEIKSLFFVWMKSFVVAGRRGADPYRYIFEIYAVGAIHESPV